MFTKDNLPSDIDELKALFISTIEEKEIMIQEKEDVIQEKEVMIQEKETLLQKKDLKIQELLELLKSRNRKAFGSSSEGVSSEQLGLFNEAEVEIEIPLDNNKKRKKRGKRTKLPDTLPREDVLIDLKDEEKFCPHDGHALKEIGEDISEKLKIIPAKIKVIRTIRKKICLSFL